MSMRRAVALLITCLLFVASSAFAEQRFPPPDFEGGYKLPVTSTPAARAVLFQYVDMAVLLGALAIATWCLYGNRSRRGTLLLSIFSVAYFGFYRKGCICAIGSIQNVALALCDSTYALPLTALVFFIAPLAVALICGRAFCAAVCPHGAIQDLVLLKPVKVPAWLEHALGLIPFLFLGAGAAFASTGSAFVICRFDPFVPFFRFSGNSLMVGTGVLLLAIGVFVGRPYCRFLCPYGALLRIASLVSKWRVRVTPDTCTQCTLCRHSCPFGAMREPAPALTPGPALALERKRLGVLLLLVPALIAGGAFAGSRLVGTVAGIDPSVNLARRFVSQSQHPVPLAPMTPETLSLQRAEAHPDETLAAGSDALQRLKLAGWLFGGWVGLVIGAKLISLSVRSSRRDFEPDRGACVGCARCFADCPEERARHCAVLCGGAHQ